MYTLTLSNEKGGVGKTTTAVHIAAAAAIAGKRVLVIDTDSQGHAGLQLGVKPFGGLYRLLVQEAEWREVLRQPDAALWAGSHTVEGMLAVLPSNLETRGIPLMVDDVHLLSERIEELGEYFDLVVFDTPPNPTLLQAMVYFASDGIVFPAQCEALSLDGLAKTMIHMKKESERRTREGRQAMKLLGVQPTRYKANTNAHRYGLQQIKDHFGAALTWEPISERTVWSDASYAQKTIFAYAPDDIAAHEAWSMAERIFGVMV